MATVSLTPEEEGWVKAADAAHDGKGISLADVDLNDMKEVYDALKVTGLAQSRLRSLIKKLQQQQQQQQQSAPSIRRDHSTMAKESPTKITTDFLRSFAALQNKTEEQLNLVVTQLKQNLIETTAELATVSRASLKDASFPVLVIDALKPEQEHEHERQPKRRKDFSKLDPPELVKELRDLAAPQIGTLAENPKVHRWPYHETVDTWNWTEMRNQLCGKRTEIQERLKTYKRLDRQNVVLGMRLGSGFGKTHLLTEAPRLLQAQGLYVSYNMGQDLRRDRESPAQALLVRLMLTACGCSQLNCGEFIRSENFDFFRHLPADLLRNCFLHLAKHTLSWGEIVIGIDEVVLLGGDPIKLIISELAELSHVYATADPQSRCTCIVSSLKDKVFATKSGRSVEDWNPRHPDETTFEHFARAITSMGKEESMALANAVCGNHMRSIVIVFDEIRKGSQPTVRSLLSTISEKLGNKITKREFDEVCEYVHNCILRHVAPSPSDAVEPYVGDEMALPPVIMTKAFEGKPGEVELHGILNSFSVFDGGAGKQLEEIGKYYDLFRAARRLPVIPARATIYGTSSRPKEWYRKLVFNDITEESSEDLLKLQNVAGTKQVEVVPTGIMPEWGKYYHPGTANHPWLDRLVVGAHSDDGSKCMIIYQDKVNQNDFASACKNLDKAADLLSSATKLNDVLLVVNVIGASELTRAQASLKWPYILVREIEISHFYSCNFASMVGFARKRHLLSQKASPTK